MLKEATYKEKFSMLKSWMPVIIDVVKKDLKNEHMRRDPSFVRQYFQGKNPSKVTNEDLVEAYSHAIENIEQAEELAEYICNRWLLKNSELYLFFEESLTKINPNFSDLEVLENQVATELMENAIQKFGAPNTYLFSVLNSVVFPREIYATLGQRAETGARQAKVEAVEQQEKASIESMQRNYDQQIARLTDKYEKKLAGLQKKYTTDVEALKKQVAQLQRKLNA